MNFELFAKPIQASPGRMMKCPKSDTPFKIKRRGRVEGRVGILIQFTDGTDIAVVDAKNQWLVESETS